MKMTDNLGRSLGVDLVRMAEGAIPGQMLRTRPPEFNLEHAGTTFAAMPHGEFALRIIASAPIELKVFQEGRLITEALVQKGINYLERDANGAALYFGAPGSASPTPIADVPGFGTEGISLIKHDSGATIEGGDQQSLLGDAAFGGEQLPNVVPNEAGLVFVVARFAPDPTIAGQPPRIEYEMEFKLREPDAHHSFFAENMASLVVAPPPLNPTDLLSLEAPEQPAVQFTCSCTGCKSRR